MITAGTARRRPAAAGVPRTARWLAARSWVLPLSVSAAGWVVLLARGELVPSGHDHGRASTIELTAMALAMMMPLSVMPVRHVAQRSIGTRMPRSLLLFVAAFAACWIGATLVLAGVVGAVVPEPSPAIAVPGLLVAAAIVQITPWRTRLAVLCHWPMPLRSEGLAADVDCGRYGVVSAARCIQTCALPMAVCLVQAHNVVLMAALTLIAVIERGFQHPRHLLFAVAYLVLALFFLS